MVGGNHIDSAVQKSFKKSLLVANISQRRIHLEAPILLKHGVVHCKVVGAGFAANGEALLLSLADKLNALL